MKIRCTLAALAFGLALAAVPAQASDRTIVFNIGLDLERPASCAADDWFGLAFHMTSPSGRALGTGQSCVHSISPGCTPFRPFCRQTVDATFTLDFARGSIRARMRLLELEPTESSVVQRGTGRITSGTGDFARAGGRVDGGGIIIFTDDEPVSAVLYAVRVRS